MRHMGLERRDRDKGPLKNKQKDMRGMDMLG